MYDEAGEPMYGALWWYWCVNTQWLKWSCEAGGGGGSPGEARLEQTPYQFHTQLIWRYLGIK